MTKYIEAIEDAIEKIRFYDTGGYNTEKSLILFREFVEKIKSIQDNEITYDNGLAYPSRTYFVIESLLDMEIPNE